MSGSNQSQPAENNVFNGVTEQADGARRGLGKIWQRAKEEFLPDVHTRDSNYAYKKLDADHNIRLLKIYCGESDAILQCRLIDRPLLATDIPLEKRQAYTALSYYWGTDDAKNKAIIFADDAMQKRISSYSDADVRKSMLQSSAFVWIQDNLNNALRQLRSTDEDVYVWADAICIRQKDNKEKTAQVAIMHEVYRQAKEVCIWLGEASTSDNENRETFDFLRKILDLKKLEEHVQGLQKYNAADMKACLNVTKLMKSDWFRRRWVIQELALATNAHVRRGDRGMNWTDFADSISFLMTKVKDIKHAYESRPQSYSLPAEESHLRSLEANAFGATRLITLMNRLFRKSNLKESQVQKRLLSLEQLVTSMLLAFEASKPKDTIFAVLQIAKDTTTFKSTKGQTISWILKLVVLVILGLLALTIDLVSWERRKSHLFVYQSNSSSAALCLSIQSSWISEVWIPVLIHIFVLLLCWSVFMYLFRWLGSDFIDLIVRDPTAPVVDERIQPKYEKPIIDVYGDFIDYCIETSQSLDILCRHWAPTKDKMPSWILPISGYAFNRDVEFPRRINGNRFVGESSERPFYAASGNTKPVYKFGKNRIVSIPEERGIEEASDDSQENEQEYADPLDDSHFELPPRFDGTLEVCGFVLGTIERTNEILGGVIGKTALETLGWSANERLPEEKIDQLWRTLVANRGPEGSNPPNWYRRVCLAWLERSIVHEGGDQFNTQEFNKVGDAPPLKVEFLERVQEVIWGRRCFRTSSKNGDSFVGLAPPETQEGDLICILLGCSVPVVLRKFESGFRFLGGCYVHGMMDGEAVDPKPKRTRTFTLRGDQVRSPR